MEIVATFRKFLDFYRKHIDDIGKYFDELFN